MSRFLFFLYRILLDFTYILLSPFLSLIFGKSENKQRLGFETHFILNCIWIHAASVGEVNACKGLVKELLDRHPDRDILLTTTSTTGMKTAQAIDPKLHTHLLPLDIPLLMGVFIKAIHPAIVILIETEIWPVMLYQVNKLKIPVIWVNARISDTALPKYKKMTILWKIIQSGVYQINAQSELDVERFRSLGLQNVVNAGNLKFALKLPSYERNELRTTWNIPQDAFVLVFGSSRPGEEILLREALPFLMKEIPKLYIILVPRHLKRLEEVKEIFADVEHGLYTEYSCLKSTLQNDPKSNLQNRLKSAVQLVIVDKMGVLVEAYALADLAIIGGSFSDFGGHNPLEAAFYGLPIIMGSYHSSCRDSVKKLEDKHAIWISESNSLAGDIVALAKDEALRKNMGNAALTVMEQYSDSLIFNLKTIEKWL